MNDKTKICKLLVVILAKSSVGRNPPDDMIVKVKLNESKSLIFSRLYIKITKMVEKK